MLATRVEMRPATRGGGVSLASNSSAPAESGLAALVLLLRFHGIGADPEQIRHRFGDAVGVPEMLRCAKEFGLKAKSYQSSWRRLRKTPLPGIATLRDGGYLLLGKASEDQVIVQNPRSSRPRLMFRDEFEAIWDGRLILMAGRAGLMDLTRHFDIRWFLAPSTSIEICLAKSSPPHSSCSYLP